MSLVSTIWMIMTDDRSLTGGLAMTEILDQTEIPDAIENRGQIEARDQIDQTETLALIGNLRAGRNHALLAMVASTVPQVLPLELLLQIIRA